MAKYIDIDKAQLEFYKAHEGDEFTPNIITLQTFLLYYPPADVRPVVRGQWKFATNPMLHDGPGPSCWCSECKKPPIDKKIVWYHLDGTFAREGEEFVLSDFCPNCGADMRGGDADGEEKD